MSMKGRLKEDGVDSYVKMLIHLVGIYVLGSMQANNKLPRDVKQFPSAGGKSDDSDPSQTDIERAQDSSPPPSGGSSRNILSPL